MQLTIYFAGAMVVFVFMTLFLATFIMPEYKMAADCHCAPFGQLALCIINESHRDCTCVPLGTTESEGERICLEEAEMRI